MRISYLILAHHLPDQLRRLLDVLLDDAGATAAVHIDAKADIEPFRSAVSDYADRVVLLERRQNVRWGDFASVRATLDLLRTARSRFAPDYVILLSGVDYPIRPVRTLHAELASGAVYMEFIPMPDPARGKPMSRLERRYFAGARRDSKLFRAVNLLMRVLPRRNVIKGLRGFAPFGGSQWWALPQVDIDGVLRFVDAHPGLVRFFERSQNPDEMFFQTVVKASGSTSPVRRPLTWADWSRLESQGSGPATLGVADVPTLGDRDAMFARKFDSSRDTTVLDSIDAKLLRRSS